ncbi:uncharacterized protein LOC120066987 [Benincasa hispida]|uniref:uncharacterized protein LOC120066987 n=1 Tax=Benincasa hispida TaxID=102211 RepID=UPI0019005D15|nr:uncharacterized protein LOC120066987 [Benincasa hispida]
MTSLLQTMAIQQGHLSQGSAQANALTHMAAINCVQCGEGHSVEVCSLNQQPVYSIYNESFDNTYNPGWQNHPTFIWGGNHNQGGQDNHQNNHHGNRGNPPVFIDQSHISGNFQSMPPYDQPFFSVTSCSNSSLETLLKHYIKKNKAIKQSQASSLRNLEEQIEQLVIELKNKSPSTLFSSSGASGPCDVYKRQVRRQDLNEQPIEQEVRRDPPPFPSRLRKKDDSKQFQRFLDVLRQFHINIPLIEALEQMSSYVKFLKDILANKRKIEENETVALTYKCSALFKNNIPTKMKDPGSFTLPCSIGGKKVENALCDLGASINLMPLSFFKKLKIGNARPTTITL